MLLFKENITYIFVNSNKEPQITSQNKETTMQSFRKMLNQNTKKSAGIEFALFDYTGEMGMDNFGCLNSSLSLFFFKRICGKKFIMYVRLQLNLLPPSQTSQYAFSWTTPPPLSVRTLWITTNVS